MKGQLADIVALTGRGRCRVDEGSGGGRKGQLMKEKTVQCVCAYAQEGVCVCVCVYESARGVRVMFSGVGRREEGGRKKKQNRSRIQRVYPRALTTIPITLREVCVCFSHRCVARIRFVLCLLPPTVSFIYICTICSTVRTLHARLL